MTPITVLGFRLWQSSDFSWIANVDALPEDFCQDYQGAAQTPEEALGALIKQIARDGKLPIVATYYPQRVSHEWPLRL
jgi:hypothetical protein